MNLIYENEGADISHLINDQREALSIKLINQACWSKITYNFGQIGPEIMFFCRQDKIRKEFIPDLEPIKITLR